MAVKVLITRRCREGGPNNVFSSLRKLRALAMDQPGYITGESLLGYDDPNKILVIGTWQSVENWLSWKENAQRMKEEAKIQEFLAGPTEYEIFVLGIRPTK
ncbi:MAG: antibiotic biosynthesis monooxygenase [Pseudomonadota bacterium]